MGAVTIAIDGNSYGSASYGGNMQGVCDIMGNYPGCPNVGWSFPINRAELTNGGHTLTVTTFSSELVPRSVSQSVLFYASNADPSAQNQPTVMIDVPAAQATYSGTQTFFGWALDDASAISSVGVAIDGISYGNVSYGVNRSDVCAYPNRAGCPNVGWGSSIDTAELQDGAHSLTMTALTSDATPRKTTTTVTFSRVIRVCQKFTFHGELKEERGDEERYVL